MWETLRLLVTSARANKGTPRCQQFSLSTIRHLNGPLRRKLPLKAQSTSGSNCYSSDTTSMASTTSTHSSTSTTSSWWFYFFHVSPYLGRWSNLTNNVSKGLTPPTRTIGGTGLKTTRFLHGICKVSPKVNRCHRVCRNCWTADVWRTCLGFIKHLLTDPWEWYIYRWCFQICFIFHP